MYIEPIQNNFYWSLKLLQVPIGEALNLHNLKLMCSEYSIYTVYKPNVASHITCLEFFFSISI